jgi:2-polyprenyl-3-methyl-5-hydroxy-6-metoxy-1,4-benzoquinol methylase
MDNKFEANEISEYFRRVHRDSLKHGSRDSLGPVISPGGNYWLTRYRDYAHRLGMRHVFRFLDEQVGALTGRRVLDLGCGRGRWVKEYASRGAKVTGVDISPEAVHALRGEFPEHDFLCQDLTELEVPAESFDVVNSVTVLQHLPLKSQERVVCRVEGALKDGGYLVLLENVYDQESPIVFSRPANAWVEMVQAAGLRHVGSWGSNYEILLRIGRQFTRRWGKAATEAQDGIRHVSVGGGGTAGPDLSRVWSTIKTLIALISYPTELVLQHLAIASPTHSVMIFRKSGCRRASGSI